LILAIDLRGYIDENGTKRFAEWLEGLDAPAAAKVTIGLARMEQGNFSNVKGAGSGVFEYKIDFGPGYRIYFGKDGDRLVILLGGGKKKRQQTGHRGGARMLGCLQAKKEAGDSVMPLTHDFKETIRARAQSDPDFRQALLREAVECVINGDLETGKAVLRDYVNATVGFQDLEKRTRIPAKSLMRMLGPRGSPSAANLSRILTALQKTEGVHFELSLRR
jgi:putative addiction module killer protein